MDTIRECHGFKLMFDPKNNESVIVNSNIDFYGDFKMGKEAIEEVEEVRIMSELSFVTYSVVQMRDKYQKED